MIRSDNGSNFIGASSELVHAFQEMDHLRISNYLKEHSGEWMNWKRNPPFASNMGGVWEWQIWSARMILCSLLKTHGGNLTWIIADTAGWSGYNCQSGPLPPDNQWHYKSNSTYSDKPSHNEIEDYNATTSRFCISR